MTGGADDAGAAAGVAASLLGTVTSWRAPLEPSMMVTVFCSTAAGGFAAVAAGMAGEAVGAIAFGAMGLGAVLSVALASAVLATLGFSTTFTIGSPPSGSSLKTA